MDDSAMVMFFSQLDAEGKPKDVDRLGLDKRPLCFEAQRRGQADPLDAHDAQVVVAIDTKHAPLELRLVSFAAVQHDLDRLGRSALLGEHAGNSPFTLAAGIHLPVPSGITMESGRIVPLMASCRSCAVVTGPKRCLLSGV